MTLTTQRGTIVVTDAAGDAAPPGDRLARPAPDRGPASRSAAPTGLAFRALGVRETVATFQADAEANWLRANEPDIWAADRRFLFLSGFLTRRLVGRFVDSVAAQVGYVPFDYKRLRWARAGRLEVDRRAGRAGAGCPSSCLPAAGSAR